MSTIPFLTINGETLSLSQSISYLKESGLFPQLLADIIRQHILRGEIERRGDLEVSTAMVDQAIMDFRLQAQLTDSEKLNQWLQESKLTYEVFREQVVFRLKVNLLQDAISDDQLNAYFQERKLLLDRVVLSRIILEDQDKANLVKDELMRDRTQFGQLAQIHSITDDRVAHGMMGPVSRGQMPDILRAAIDLAQAGDIIGPLDIDGRYCIFRIEQLLPAVLEGSLKQELKNQLFEQWLHEKMQSLDIQLLVK